MFVLSLTLPASFDTFVRTTYGLFQNPIPMKESPMIPVWFRNTLFGVTVVVALSLTGCGTVQEGSNEEDWTNTPPLSLTARLEYRIDSLTNENRRMRQQIDALQTENTNLNARLVELQSAPSEPVMAEKSEPKSATTSPRSTASTPGYEGALAKFRKRDFQGAIDQFTGLLTSGVSEDLADNCQYWIGESYFGLKKYDDAIHAFELVANMTGSDKADDAQLMIGNSYAALGKKAEAREALQKLTTAFPGSPLVKRAKAKMNSL